MCWSLECQSTDGHQELGYAKWRRLGKSLKLEQGIHSSGLERLRIWRVKLELALQFIQPSSGSWISYPEALMIV